MDTNLPVGFMAAPGHEAPGAIPSEHGLSGQALLLPGGVLAILYRSPPSAGGGSVNLTIDDQPVPLPVAATEIGGHPSRQAILCRVSGEVVQSIRGDSAAIRVRRGSSLSFSLPIRCLDHLSDLVAALSAPAGEERGDLLAFLVETCTNVLRAGRVRGIAHFLHQLAVHLAPPEPSPQTLRLQPLATEADDGLSLWGVSGESGPGPWYLLTGTEVRRLAPPVAGLLMVETPLRHDVPVMLLPSPSPGASRRMPITLLRRPAGLPQLLASAAKGDTRERVLARALARRLAAEPNNTRLARLLRDRRLLTPLVPSQALDNPLRPVGGALEMAVSDGHGGVFVGGWLRDPFGLVAGGLALRDPLTGISQTIPPTALERMARPDLTDRFVNAVHGGGGSRPGFLAHVPNVERATGGPVPQWGLDLRLVSGEALSLTAPPGLLPPVAARDLVLRSVHPSALRPELLDRCIMPAVERLQRAALAALGPAEVVHIGSPIAVPRVAVVIPLYKNLRFLRFQIAAFARDPALRQDAHVVFVLDSPEQRAELEHQLRGLNEIYDLPVTMVVMAANAGYASACNAGVAAASPAADTVLLLNSDIIPTIPGWLRAMLRPLDADKATLAVGPKLLFEDGSVQHAGLFFAREGAQGDWLNGHYGKGLPRRHPFVMRGCEVPGVTGAALLVRRDAFEAVGGVCTDYVVGDYEDSDLCLRLRELGGTIRYVPSAELYHFERQSIVGHGGYARTLACAHNRRLHHCRWNGAITALMAGFPAADGASRAKR
ncbi:glycosyltransferase [Roseomonas vinacea]|uniref:Glycosyltransferase n=1 Tax=Muricoccus vinaceus TaxID=424704 RepID=A0ABV6J0A4_9PROT